MWRWIQNQSRGRCEVLSAPASDCHSLLAYVGDVRPRLFGDGDVAAGSLLVTEAGGRITDLRGQPLRLSKPQIVASNGLIHDEMLRLLAKGI